MRSRVFTHILFTILILSAFENKTPTTYGHFHQNLRMAKSWRRTDQSECSDLAIVWGTSASWRQNPASDTRLSPMCSSLKLLSNMTYLFAWLRSKYLRADWIGKSPRVLQQRFTKTGTCSPTVITFFSSKEKERKNISIKMKSGNVYITQEHQK